MQRRADQLYQALLQSRPPARNRLPMALVWQAFEESFPHLRGNPVAREELAQLIQLLQQRQQIRLPKTARGYDRFATPELPRWISLPTADPPSTTRAQAIAAAWHPALAFVRHLGRLGHEELSCLLRIQRFVAESEAHGPIVTDRERSLELFGDDKKLEKLLANQLHAHAPTLRQLLGCYAVALPFVVQDFGQGRSMLIIENKDTFHSACRAAIDLGPRFAHRWLVFGAGNAILRAIDTLPTLNSLPEEIFYFGDLDRRGLTIARQLQKRLPQIIDSLELACADELYQRLVEQAQALGLTCIGQPTSQEQSMELACFLPIKLQPIVGDILRQGLRWPQEAVSYPHLRELLARC